MRRAEGPAKEAGHGVLKERRHPQGPRDRRGLCSQRLSTHQCAGYRRQMERRARQVGTGTEAMVSFCRQDLEGHPMFSM